MRGLASAKRLSRDRDADRCVVQHRLVLEPLQLGHRDVARDRDQVLLPVEREARGRHQALPQRAVAPPQRDRDVDRHAALAHLVDHPAAVLLVVPEAELERGASDRLGALPAHQAGEAAVDHRQPARLHVADGREVGAHLEQPRQHRLRVAQPRVGAALLGDVEVQRHVGRAVGQFDPAHEHLHEQVGAVAPPQPHLGGWQGGADRQAFQFLHARKAELARRLVVEDHHRLAGQGPRVGKAEQLGRRGVGEQHLLAPVQDDRRRRAVEQIAEALLARRALALCDDVGRHVARDTPVAAKAAAGVEHRLAADTDMQDLAIGSDAPHRQVAEGPACRQVGAVRVPVDAAVGRSGQLPRRLAKHGRRVTEERANAIGDVRETQLVVLFPVVVGRDVEQPGEAALLLARATQRLEQQLRQCAAEGRARRHQQQLGAEARLERQAGQAPNPGQPTLQLGHVHRRQRGGAQQGEAGQCPQADRGAGDHHDHAVQPERDGVHAAAGDQRHRRRADVDAKQGDADADGGPAAPREPGTHCDRPRRQHRHRP
ncbi:MAG: hypothetical protein U5L03_02485 [Burkholderiaceae bacterium]|nr:hypothetical protein [Burkholderiaceae bacterium]